MEKNDCVRVIVRVRPETAKEQATARPIIKVVDSQLLVFDPKEEEDYFNPTPRQLRRPNKDLRFMYDHIFDASATNEDVYQHTTKHIVPELLKGYNCSVFAYGATGAGKTHTMLGTEYIPGIAFLTVIELYEKIEAIADKNCEISISYLEVYNEAVKDLMSPGNRSLAVREDPQRGVVIPGLSLHKPCGAEELLSMLVAGNRNRTQHPTDANAESSRSHAVFQVYVKIQDKGGLNPDTRVAKMSLIDLAGSERASATRKHGVARLREGANINKSLLALASCINALASSRKVHVPYRNSKLTHLLKDSIGGNCRTIMIAAVGPSSLHYEDTYNTLKYADRARAIQLTLKKNVINVDIHLSKYAKVVEELRQENTELKERVRELEAENNSLRVMMPPSSNDSSPTRAEVEQTSCETRYQTLRKQLLVCESNLRQLQLKLRWRQHCYERISRLTTDHHRLLRSTAKKETALRSLQQREKKLLEQQTELRQSLEEMEPPAKRAKVHQLTGDVRELRLQSHHLEQVAVMQSQQLELAQKLLLKSFELNSEQQQILQGHGFLTQDLKVQHEALLRAAEASKEVVWADQADPEEAEQGLSKLLHLPVESCLPLTPKPNATPLVSIRNISGGESITCHRSLNSPFQVLAQTSDNLNSTFDVDKGAGGDKDADIKPLTFAQVLKSPALLHNGNSKRVVVAKIHRPFYTGPSGRPTPAKKNANHSRQWKTVSHKENARQRFTRGPYFF